MVYITTKLNNGIQVWTHPSTDKKDNSTSSVYHLQKAVYTCSKSNTVGKRKWGNSLHWVWKIHTKKAGFIVDDEKCWLGASPDAWVCDSSVDCNCDGIAEFKYPYTMADKSPEELCTEKSFYLCFVKHIPCFKRDHSYYHQVQLQLYVTRFMAHRCDFCVYISKGVVVERILPDKQWQEECIPKLDKYFFDHILPELIDPPVFIYNYCLIISLTLPSLIFI